MSLSKKYNNLFSSFGNKIITSNFTCEIIHFYEKD